MKNIIDGKLKVCVTGDNMENIQVRELVPFKAGDILAIYGTWVKGNSDGLEYQTIVIPSTDQLAISLKKTIKKTINEAAS